MPPNEKYFTNQEYDGQTRTFTGTIDMEGAQDADQDRHLVIYKEGTDEQMKNK